MPAERTAVAPTPSRAPEHFDLVLVGGGLANGLIALASLARDPARSIALVERADRVGGNHTWCLHPGDVPAGARDFVDPLLVHRWAGYDVRFPGMSRRLEGEYAAVTSTRLAERVEAAFAASPGSHLLLGRSATAVGAHDVTLDDGRRLRGTLVVDARGPDPRAAAGRAGYQKFLGLELELAADHDLARPLLMDATVEQLDGFRFLYVLPLGPRRLLVEDTRFSASPVLDAQAAQVEVLRYAARFGCVRDVTRSERGVLPMSWSGDDTTRGESPLVAGYRGGFCHPATGYSFPPALRLASHLATRPTDEAFDAAFVQLMREHHTQVRYAQHLNWLLFHCFDPDAMWNVFARFYRLPEPLIHRFYAMSTTRSDRARILIGKPPRGMSLRTALTNARAS